MDPKAEKIYNLAHKQLRAGDVELAYGMASSAIRQFPESAPLLQVTALAAFQMGLNDEAIELCERAWAIDPNNYILAYNYATILLHLERATDAREWLVKSLTVNPDYAPAHANLGSVLIAFGELDEALLHLDRCIELGTGTTAEVLINRASALRDLGKIDEALQGYRNAIALDSESQIAHANYLLCLNYSQQNQATIKKEHEAWGASQSHGQPPIPMPVPAGKIKVGYVSPDFRRHSVAFFLESVLKNHDHENFEIVCVSNTQREDAVTENFKKLSHQWIDVKNLDAPSACAAIQEAGIHILVDLAAHTAHNRLDIFAQRAAPIQATWLGYPNTTGLPEMDYRIGDALTDPPGFAQHYSEQLVHLPKTFICFCPPEQYPSLDDSGSPADSPITFGSFNLLAKINHEVIRVWSQILHQVEDSKILLKSRQLASEAAKERYLKLFEQNGIDSSRVILKSHVNSFMEHLNLYREVDIGLDPFPYHGTTTTCEALLMGTPVLTLAGERHSARVGASLLSALGMGDWVSKSVSDYIEKAVNFAGADKELSRQEIRKRFLESSLCDTSGFTRDLESLFKDFVAKSTQG
ncbi:MAG: tetratricopeptide repeat protein [Deltaproteobacteria bacterium]|jgi:protein O-GlcNAc transferase|nr:tetratricopeptide repeat protein [Deltaproteobacteria bacterium]MBT6432256.1 tetratricopeptide repeat protein [Deltaproteobacteria bacterium]MBT6488287.1 tetratricopeptide repeat protein [Deltaproteobacteria bacterium]